MEFHEMFDERCGGLTDARGGFQDVFVRKRPARGRRRGS